MSGVRRLARGVAIAALAIAPWAVVFAYAWANNTLVDQGHNSTNWSDVIQILIPLAIGVAVLLGFCLALQSMRPYVRGWRIIPASWIFALGGMFWIGLTTMGF